MLPLKPAGLAEAPKTTVPAAEGKRFINLLNEMTSTQNGAQEAVYNLLTKGQGQAHEILIQQMKAESQMKTASVIRDNLIENYKQLMNTQI
ncbi:MAG: flagellar hook-basal body complex protein FliE [Ectobacillus sp.]